MTTTQRPDPPSYQLAGGRTWTPHPTGGIWRVDTERRCVDGTGGGTKGCGLPSVAAINRQRWRRNGVRIDAWYGVCAEHLAQRGRWVEDGKVWYWGSSQ